VPAKLKETRPPLWSSKVHGVPNRYTPSIKLPEREPGTALVAVLAPYFGTVLGAVGGLTDALQSFVLPPLIALKLLHHRGPMTQYFYKAIVVWGLCTICYTVLKMLFSLSAAAHDFLI
jgi:hypothetical protein